MLSQRMEPQFLQSERVFGFEIKYPEHQLTLSRRETVISESFLQWTTESLSLIPGIQLFVP